VSDSKSYAIANTIAITKPNKQANKLSYE